MSLQWKKTAASTGTFQTGSFQWNSGTAKLLVFQPCASSKLFGLIGWLRDDFPDNRNEQGGILIGRYIRDADGHPVQAEVTDILLAQTECRYPGYIEWDAMEEIRLQRIFFDMKDKLEATDPEAADELDIVGWWHTHPNGLPVFMSVTDMETQKIKCSRMEKYSVVLNPHQGIWRAFAGKDAEEVPAVMLIGNNPGDAGNPVHGSCHGSPAGKREARPGRNVKKKKKGWKHKKPGKKGR